MARRDQIAQVKSGHKIPSIIGLSYNCWDGDGGGATVNAAHPEANADYIWKPFGSNNGGLRKGSFDDIVNGNYAPGSLKRLGDGDRYTYEKKIPRSDTFGFELLAVIADKGIAWTPPMTQQGLGSADLDEMYCKVTSNGGRKDVEPASIQYHGTGLHTHDVPTPFPNTVNKIVSAADKGDDKFSKVGGHLLKSSDFKPGSNGFYEIPADDLTGKVEKSKT